MTDLLPMQDTSLHERHDSNDRLYVELYKAYLQTAENTSSRRLTTNASFLTANTIIFAAYTFITQRNPQLSGVVSSFGHFKGVVPLFGMFLSIFWLLSLLSYRTINKVKFKVLDELEAKLGTAIFVREWEILEKMKIFRLSTLEMSLPFGMLVLHFIAFILFQTGI